MAVIATIAASPSARSRTDAVLARAASRLTGRGHHIAPIALRDLPAEPLLGARSDDPALAAALATVAASDAIVIATPVYQAAYSGLLKVFLDLMAPPLLRGKDILPLATGGTPANVLSLDHSLRPVLEAIGADHVVRGRVVLSSAISTDQTGRRVLGPDAIASVDAVTDTFAERVELHEAHRRRLAERRSVAVVGAGPRAIGLVERLGANLADADPDASLVVHVVDPYPPGPGRIWRSDQSRLLWMNSTAEDTTIFLDASVTCEGPISPGPSLAQWVAGVGRARLLSQGWPVDDYTPTSFLPRGVQAEYLAWAWQQARAGLPRNVSLRVHRDRAVDLTDAADRQRITLASGATLEADIVFLAQGHLDQQPTSSERATIAAATARGLTYVPPGLTADLDLDALAPGEPVIVRGLGLAFVDLAVLLAEGRGGHFSGEFTGGAHDLTYHPSGSEPILYAGSGRGVPYHAKLGYAIGSGPAPLVHLTPERIDQAAGGASTIDFSTQLWPLIAVELTASHYRRLFSHHAERTRRDPDGRGWDELEALLARDGADGSQFRAAIEAAVPDPADRFDPRRIDRPLAGVRFADADHAQETIVGHIAGDLARRADPDHSPERAVFDTLVSIYGAMGTLLAAGRISAFDRLSIVEGRFKGFFSFLASGPPPRRLAELLALHRAGVLRFIGPDLDVRIDDDAFVATSAAVPGEVRARSLVDAFLSRVDLAATADPLLLALLDRGELLAERAPAPDRSHTIGGLLTTDARARTLRADGQAHPRRYAAGPSVSGSAGAAGFARPGFNGPAFRQNDRLARAMLTDLGFGVPVARNIAAFEETRPTTIRPTPNHPTTNAPITRREHVA